MTFYVSYMNVKGRIDTPKDIQIDILLRQFDNRTMDFCTLLQTFGYLREEIEIIDMRYPTQNGTMNDIYHTEKGTYTLTVKFYSGYFAGYLFFKKID